MECTISSDFQVMLYMVANNVYYDHLYLVFPYIIASSIARKSGIIDIKDSSCKYETEKNSSVLSQLKKRNLKNKT